MPSRRPPLPAALGRSLRTALGTALLVPAALLLAALAPGVRAQGGFVVERYGADNGLPVDGVQWVLEGPDGSLWVGTHDGLARFDGTRFALFTLAEHPELPSNRFPAGVLAADGSLWLHTRRPVRMQWAPEAPGGVLFTAFDETRGFIGTRVHHLYEDPRDGAQWVGTDGGLARADGDRLHRVASGGAEGVFRVFRAHDGALWTALPGGGARRLPPTAASPPRDADWAAFGPADGLAPGRVFGFADRPGGALWLLAGSGISRYAGGRMARVPVQGAAWPRDPVRVSVHVLGGQTWIAVESGVPEHDLFLRLDGGALLAEPTEALDAAVRRAGRPRGWLRLGQRFYYDGRPVVQPAGYVNSALVDRTGTLWLATHREGLFALRPSLFTPIGAAEGLPEDNVYAVYGEPGGTVWVGTMTRGLGRLRFAADGGLAATATFTTADGLPSENVRTVLRDRAGALWVGTEAGLTRFAPGASRPAEPTAATAEHLLPGRAVEAAIEDRAGRLWFGAEDGLHGYDPGSGRWMHLAEGLAPVRALLESGVRGPSALWLGTNGGGIARVRGGRVERLTVADGLAGDLVRALHEDERGVLWVGTEGRGLTRLDPRGAERLADARLTTIRRADGLFDDGIHQILDDGHGRLWMSTNRGLFWVLRADLDAFAEALAAGRPARVHATAYTEADGLRHREFNGGVQPAGFRAADGRLWFPSQAGVVVVDPARVAPRAVAVAIGAVRAGGEAFPGGAPLRLPRGRRTLEIAFEAPAPTGGRRLHVEYRLDGADEDWVPAGDRRAVRYERLPPGVYTFHLRAHLDGAWSAPEAPLRITVPPHFRETNWFALLVALGLLGLGVAGTGFRARRLRARARALEAEVAERTAALRAEKETTEQQAERLRELDRLKTRFFTNVSHEFRTPLALTIGPLEDLEAAREALPTEARQAVDMALRNSRRLFRLTGQLLDAARLEAGEMALHPRPLDLAAEVRALALPFVALAERRRMRFEIDTGEALGEPLAALADPEHLETIVVNLLSNAFKFTPEGGTIRIELAPDGDAAVIRVRDDGHGIPAADLPHVFERFFRVDETAGEHVGSGIGLSLVKDLAALHGGSATVESTPGVGSAFTVRLPRSPDAPPPAGRPAPTDDGPGAYPEPPTGDGWSAPPEPLAPEDPDADPRPLVLVADDHPDIRAYVRAHLERRYRVREAPHGEAALALARAEPPDLIVSDVMMPRLDGVGLVRALRSDPETDFIPVVLLTAKAEEADVLEGLGTGADDYVVKPFSMRTLQARIENLIASRQHLRERFAAQDRPIDAAPEAAFLTRARTAVEARLGDERLSVEAVAEALGINRTTLHRRLRALTGRSTTEFVLEVRLDRAHALLVAGAGNVSEVAYAVGFRSVSHFSQAFRARFGASPSAVRGVGAPQDA